MLISELKYVGNTPHIYMFNAKPLNEEVKVLNLDTDVNSWYDGYEEGELFIFPDERNGGMDFNSFPYPIMEYSEKNPMKIVGYTNEEMNYSINNWECIEIPENIAEKMRNSIEFLQ